MNANLPKRRKRQDGFLNVDGDAETQYTEKNKTLRNLSERLGATAVWTLTDK